jgi:hypothetical protein
VTERLAYSVAELQQVLGVGRGTALRLANEIGIRISPRRIVVPRVRLEQWMGGETSVQTSSERESAPRPVAESRG